MNELIMYKPQSGRDFKKMWIRTPNAIHYFKTAQERWETMLCDYLLYESMFKIKFERVRI